MLPGQGEAAGEAPPDPAMLARVARLRRVQAAVQGRAPTQRDAERKLFASRLTDPGLRADFDRHGWMSARNAQAIVEFWDEMAPEQMAEDPEGRE